MSQTVLRSGDAFLSVARLGAEARAWRVGGADLLWPGDPAIWHEISPLLFPVVGWTRNGARVGGRRYALGLHGFARRLDFEVERQSEDFVRLVARADEATRAVYPFAFSLAVEYALAGPEWCIALEATNAGGLAMPYACGLHPGFNLPFGRAPRAGARVRFSSVERGEVPILAPGGLMGTQMRAIPLEGGTVVPVQDEIFARDALCFLNPASPSLRFEQADGSAIEMDRGDFAHVALWRRPNGPYLCLEAWTGYSDPEGFVGDLYEKPGMRVLEPGETARHAAVYRYCAPTR